MPGLKTTKKLTVYGLVQGVGFRPYVRAAAKSFGLSGNVKNIGGIVEIYINADDKILDGFVRYLISHKPAGSEIYDVKIDTADYEEFSDFDIVESDNCSVIPVIPADIGVCDKCMKEFYDKFDRRFSHPFISCISCGPRYSIIKKLPYDRPNTTMDIFPMCKKCENEYTKQTDRRCYAQTVACNECGPVLEYTREGDPLENAVSDINSGLVVAVRDIGGYHFVCKASDESAVDRLRSLKLRDEKPFAVMFYNVEEIRKYAFVSDEEEKVLRSDARPITFVRKNNKNMFPKNVCESSLDIGAFLPCNPVQYVLTEKCGPLVMTSGNISGEPIITDNETMLGVFETSEFLDGVLYHGREILTPLDDSIVRIIDNKAQLVRRGRGYTPLPVWLDEKAEAPIFAAGGDLKSSFCLMAENRAYMSQYFGDLENRKCVEIYGKNVARMTEMFNISPQICGCDMHPGYYSSRYAESLSENVEKVQHHHAHIASVIAENGLKSEVLGFSFDGTGYGTDGTVWGGEALLCQGGEFERVCSLKPVVMLGGDEISKNAETAAYCYMLDAGIETSDEKFGIVKSAVSLGINTVKSSSMGRLFDAVSSILGISQYNSYEGKSAILLEMAAAKAEKAYPLVLGENGGIWDTASLIRQICSSDASAEETALGFHIAVSDAVVKTAERINVKNIALSGGVFMNRLLTELCLEKLRKKGYNVYINSKVPTNDGGIALGQAYILSERMKKDVRSSHRQGSER